MGRTLKYAFKYSLPMMIGYIVLGVSFGILMVGLDYPWWLPIFMSIVMYGGAMQFASVELLTASFHPINAIVLTLLVNARLLFYGLSMLDKYQTSIPKKALLAFGLTDETFALNVSLQVPQSLDPIQVYLGVTYFDYFYWVAGTVLGVAAGQALPIDYTGIEFSLSALFIINFFEQMIETKGYFAGAVGITIPLISLLVLGADHFMIPAMTGIILTFAWRFWHKSKEGVR